MKKERESEKTIEKTNKDEIKRHQEKRKEERGEGMRLVKKKEKERGY